MPHLACLSGALTLSKYGTCDVYLRHFLFWSVKHGLSMCQIMLLFVSCRHNLFFSFRIFQFSFQKPCSIAFIALCHLFWRSCNKQTATATSAFWTHIYYVVGKLYDIKVVLYHNDRVATVHYALKHIHQYAYVFKV